ncbi:protein TonB [Silvimonas terrae]|uniref:Protein TonB n=1 Tax=Silvimonas terrae TaxID=300266 RepID=A0A840RKZ0_9NEIS|nr:energy transducer TonB [Silvimonas terrae]MBB5193254.1 protein TonB [Silvimonas terrae]
MDRNQATRLGLVTGAHVLLIGALLHTVQTQPPLPPKEITVTLETPAPLPVVAPPEPKPPQPKPRPQPVIKREPVPKPLPKIPVARPDQVATEPPPKPVPETPPPQPEVKPAPAPAPAPAPVSQPRVDANATGNMKPPYPPVSRKLGEEGRVLLEVYIEANGSVGDIRIKQSSGFPRLDNSALETVRKWKFTPARQGGQPIAMWYVQPVTFSLSQS